MATWPRWIGFIAPVLSSMHSRAAGLLGLNLLVGHGSWLAIISARRPRVLAGSGRLRASSRGKKAGF